MIDEVLELLHSFIDKSRVYDYQRYFKTSKGEYGEGDQFLGIKVPDIRKCVKKYHSCLTLNDLDMFISSKYHEERMFALLVLVAKFKSKKNIQESNEDIYNFYMKNKKYINNWDLIDVTAPHIVGVYLLDKDRDVLYKLAKSDNLWDKRIAIISTFAFINSHQYADALGIADILLNDTHDLIHKAVGWTIRNVGVKDIEVEYQFLNSRYKNMPRTMLRYAIEKFDEDIRQNYLKGEV